MVRCAEPHRTESLSRCAYLISYLAAAHPRIHEGRLRRPALDQHPSLLPGLDPGYHPRLVGHRQTHHSSSIRSILGNSNVRHSTPLRHHTSYTSSEPASQGCIWWTASNLQRPLDDHLPLDHCPAHGRASSCRRTAFLPRTIIIFCIQPNHACRSYKSLTGSYRL